jgi:Right handed beta helix region
MYFRDLPSFLFATYHRDQVMKIFRLLLLLLIAAPGLARTLYVAKTGNDLNLGTLAQPWLTIQHAADVVDPGDTVVVEDGIYSDPNQFGPGSTLVNLTRGGTASNYITFTSQNKGGAVLDGLNNTTAEGVEFGANYIRFENFEVRGFSDDAFSNYRGGQFIEIRGNNIHNEGRYCTDTGIGRDGIYVSSNNVIIESNLIHNIGRYGPGYRGCEPKTKNYEANDQGIYISGASNVLISNNTFYRVRHGYSIQLYPNDIAHVSILHNRMLLGNKYGYTGFIIVCTAPKGSTDLRIEDNIGYSVPAGYFMRFANPTAGYTGTVARNVTYRGTISDGKPSKVTFSGNSER